MKISQGLGSTLLHGCLISIWSGGADSLFLDGQWRSNRIWWGLATIGNSVCQLCYFSSCYFLQFVLSPLLKWWQPKTDVILGCAKLLPWFALLGLLLMLLGHTSLGSGIASGWQRCLDSIFLYCLRRWVCNSSAQPWCALDFRSSLTYQIWSFSDDLLIGTSISCWLSWPYPITSVSNLPGPIDAQLINFGLASQGWSTSDDCYPHISGILLGWD